MSCSSSSSESDVWQEALRDGLLSEPLSCSAIPTWAGGCATEEDGLEEAPDAEMFRRQEESKCCCSYLETTQATLGITATQRASVVDNMIAAAARLGLDNESLFMAVGCLDRYLASKPTPLNLLQPLSVACLWVAAKYEQLVVPPAVAFSQLILGSNGMALGGTPAARHLLVMLEESVLKALDYRLASIVTTKAFKHRLMQLLCASSAAAALSSAQLDQLYCMTSYLTEVSLLEYQLLPCLPSQLAAAAYGYAHVLLGMPLDVDLLQRLSGHRLADLVEPMEFLCALHATLWRALALQRPYSVSAKYCGSAKLAVAALQPLTRPDDQRVAACSEFGGGPMAAPPAAQAAGGCAGPAAPPLPHVPCLCTCLVAGS